MSRCHSFASPPGGRKEDDQSRSHSLPSPSYYDEQPIPKSQRITVVKLDVALAHFEVGYPGEILSALRTYETNYLPTLSLSLFSVPSISFFTFRSNLLNIRSLSTQEVVSFFENMSVLVSKHYRRRNHLPKKGFPKDKFTNSEVVVIYLSTLKYVHVVLALDATYFEKNYGCFHFSRCVNVLAGLIPELREST